MANFLEDRKNSSVSIPYVERENKVTVYVIHVSIGSVNWKVKHRYSDFVGLHDILVSDHGVARDILPPKKVIGNMDPTFIEGRRTALEAYLKVVVNFLQRAMPVELAHFLHFHQYEVLFVLQNMALKFFHEGDALLQASKSYKFSPLELHAISMRLKQPCPPIDMPDKRLDFSHVLDFCCQLSEVEVEGGGEPLDCSNVVPNALSFDLVAFKCLQRLALLRVNVDKVGDAQALRTNLQALSVCHSELHSVISLTMCDVLHKDLRSADKEYVWRKLSQLNLSNNKLCEIDESLKLMPNIHTLNLSCNNLKDVQGLASLPFLSHLNLSANSFTSLKDLHLKLGNIVVLDLSDNKITSLAGFSRLFSLERLELARNAIHDVAEARHLASLPCIEAVTLTGNPVAASVDYRTRVLERMGVRAPSIYLDNEIPNQKELDTIAVLQALRIVQEGRSATQPTAPNS